MNNASLLLCIISAQVGFDKFMLSHMTMLFFFASSRKFVVLLNVVTSFLKTKHHSPSFPLKLNGCSLTNQQSTNHKWHIVHNLKRFKYIIVTGTFQKLVPDNRWTFIVDRCYPPCNVTNTEICPESLGGCYVPNDDWGLDVTFSVE